MRTVHPDSFSERVLNVHLKLHFRLRERTYMAKIEKKKKKRNLGDSYFNEDLRPVLVLLVGCHQQIASKNRHEAVSLGFKVDRSISTQEAAQGLKNNKNPVRSHP